VSPHRPRLYPEVVEAAIVLHEAGRPWPEIGCRLKVDPERLAAAAKPGAAQFRSFYLDSGEAKQ